ncbi:MAG: hypothetical protein CL840_07380 [Crocinitomicaceae bacterium]|nr:hypothetical protein [Crocinitomicaceae bacterium]|tara:strand:+ start:9119 stop:9307 length:189 start_codon:yes stop_codon:yes gene_type:complete
MIKMVKEYGIELDDNQSLYLNFCPMADDKKGGFWLSLEKEIRNPYFGSGMLHCESVKANLTK